MPEHPGSQVPLTVQADHDQFRALLIGHCRNGRRHPNFRSDTVPWTVSCRTPSTESALGRNDQALRRMAGLQQTELPQKGTSRLQVQWSRVMHFEHVPRRVATSHTEIHSDSIWRNIGVASSAPVASLLWTLGARYWGAAFAFGVGHTVIQRVFPEGEAQGPGRLREQRLFVRFPRPHMRLTRDSQHRLQGAGPAHNRHCTCGGRMCFGTGCQEVRDVLSAPRPAAARHSREADGIWEGFRPRPC